MRKTAAVLIGLVAVLHVGFLVQEMFFWTGPHGLATTVAGMTDDKVINGSAPLARNQGLYNGFLVAGLTWGLLAGPAGTRIKVFFLVCVVVAGIFGALTVNPINLALLLGQAIPGAIALASLGLAQRLPSAPPNHSPRSAGMG